MPLPSDHTGTGQPPGRPAPRRIAISALFASLALIFSYIEALIPVAPSIPGIKLGIANLVVILAMYRLDSRYALTINLVRIFLAGFMFSGLYGAIYSLCGCLVSFAVMFLLKKSGRFSVVGVSMAGGAAHNAGQLASAFWGMFFWNTCRKSSLSHQSERGMPPAQVQEPCAERDIPLFDSFLWNSV